MAERTPAMKRDASPLGQGSASGPAAAGHAAPDLRMVLLAVVAVVLLGWAIKSMATVLIPVTAAILIGLAVMPVRDWVTARVPSRLSWLGIIAAMLVVLLVLAMFIGVLVLAARQIVAQMPVEPATVVEIMQSDADESESVSDRVVAAAEEGAESGSDEGGDGSGGAAEGTGTGPALRTEAADPEGGAEGSGGDGLLSGSAGQTLRTLADQALGAAGGVATAILNSALAVLAALVLVFFLTLLLLGESGDWRRKVATALPWPDGWRLRESSEVIAGKMRAYLLYQTGIGLLSALLYALWLGFWNVGLLLVWTSLIFVLNFIPTIGSLVGGTLPVIYTLITKDVSSAIWVGLGIIVIENVMGNLVAPRVQGGNVALSPLVVLVSLVFWGWAWGIAGALLAVPVTVALVVLGAHVPVLRPWALMLSNRTEWAGLDEATRPE